MCVQVYACIHAVFRNKYLLLLPLPISRGLPPTPVHGTYQCLSLLWQSCSLELCACVGWGRNIPAILIFFHWKGSQRLKAYVNCGWTEEGLLDVRAPIRPDIGRSCSHCTQGGHSLIQGQFLSAFCLGLYLPLWSASSSLVVPLWLSGCRLIAGSCTASCTGSSASFASTSYHMSRSFLQ